MPCLLFCGLRWRGKDCCSVRAVSGKDLLVRRGDLRKQSFLCEGSRGSLSVDGGASWQDRDASFAGFATESNSVGGTGVERWKFKTPELNLDESATEFRFAAFYRNLAAGEVFWDNNFQQDYRVSKTNGATVQ